MQFDMESVYTNVERHPSQPSSSLSILHQQHLDWTKKQGQILTANGLAEHYYTPDRGYAFAEEELPHYYLLQFNMYKSCQANNTRCIFQQWKTTSAQQQQQQRNRILSTQDTTVDSSMCLLPKHAVLSIAGAWKRTLFYGGWDCTTDHDEITYNMQTNSLFIDLRIPTTRSIVLDTTTTTTNKCCVTQLLDLSGDQLRMYARQHIFAGYTQHCSTSSSSISPLSLPSNFTKRCDNTNTIHSQPQEQRKKDYNKESTLPNIVDSTIIDGCCTRHHCMDWNFVGIGRSRPNKWWIELPSTSSCHPETKDQNNLNHSNIDKWKEWAFATDLHGQYYYCEHWERLAGNNIFDRSSIITNEVSPVIALRKAHGRDGILIIIGDHFSYCLERHVHSHSIPKEYAADSTSLVDLVDAAVQRNDLDTARAWLSMQGGHGRISTGWVLDCCIEFWREGTSLWGPNDVNVQGDEESAKVLWDKDEWHIFESSISVDELRELLPKQNGGVCK